MTLSLSSWSTRRVLVTGANGFVGGWLTKTLLSSGATVIALVRDRISGSLRLHGLHESVVWIEGDVADAALVARLLNEYEVDTVFHLAAQSLVSVANRQPLSTFESNIRGTWMLLEQCRAASSVARIVVSTSDKVYGSQPGPVDEEAPLLGLHPYDASKVCADVIARCYGSTFGVPVTVIRCANIYGGGDLNYSRIIPYAIRNALCGEPVVLRGTGSLHREYLHVEDAVRAFLCAAEVSQEGGRGRSFNCGSGESVAVLHLVNRILAMVGGPPVEVTRAATEPPHEIPSQSLSSARAHDVLGWRPLLSLDDGLSRTIDWYRSNVRRPC
jgi:CDP-glucose 4,6-dehydratase